MVRYMTKYLPTVTIYSSKNMHVAVDSIFSSKMHQSTYRAIISAICECYWSAGRMLLRCIQLKHNKVICRWTSPTVFEEDHGHVERTPDRSCKRLPGQKGNIQLVIVSN